jgi:hypothetical protein
MQSVESQLTIRRDVSPSSGLKSSAGACYTRFCVWLTQHSIWRRHVPPKRRFAFTELNYILCQKIDLFAVTLQPVQISLQSSVCGIGLCRLLITLKQLRLIISYIYLLRNCPSSSCIQGYTLVKRSDYVQLSPALLLSLSEIQIFASAPCSQTPSRFVLPVLFHIDTKQLVKSMATGVRGKPGISTPTPKDFLKNRT